MAEGKTPSGYSQGEVEIIREMAEFRGDLRHLRSDMNRGTARFGDHEDRLRSLERRVWMLAGGGTAVVVGLEVWALIRAGVIGG